MAFSFKIQRAAEEEASSLIRLLGKMIPGDPARRYAWLYRTNPHGPARSWIAYEVGTGQPAACTSLFPRKVLVDGRVRVGAIGGDTFVDPKFRRQGLATALHRRVLEELGGCGVDFIYSTPVPNNLAARVKAGGRVVAPFPLWVRPLSGRSLYRGPLRRLPARLGMGLSGLLIKGINGVTRAGTRGLALEPAGTIGPEFEDVFASAAAGRAVVCVRDRAYLAWRYQAGPARDLSLFAVKCRQRSVGFVALKRAGDRATVLDLFTATGPQGVDAALQLVLNRTARAGCSRVEISCSPGSSLSPRLWRLGFIKRAGRYLQVTVTADEPQAATLLRPDAWHYLEGDEDLDVASAQRA